MSVFALLERLAPHIEREVNMMINSKQEVGTLSSRLRRIQVGLQEAERRGVTDGSVKDWLKQLEDVTYEMDDVLDQWETANLQVQLEDTSLSLSLNWDKVQSLIFSLCLCYKQVLGRREITQKMKALSLRIDNILNKRGEYKFVPSENDVTQEFKQEESTSLVNKIKIYGLDHVKDSFVKKLILEGQESDDDTQIIPIVGVGGVGKSTLARLAYNDLEVEGHFALKGWVSVSQNFFAFAIAKAILESFGDKSDDAHNLETLVQRIKKVVNNKRFLLVLDNVWIEDRNKWETIRSCLDGGNGSRIVVTTRLESVARMMGAAQWQSLGLLSDSNCGTIVNGIALEGRGREEYENLREIGVEIAKKCNGLPLAARSVGSMLALRFTEPEWRAVLESPLWRNEEEESDLFRLLNLSYIDLSPVLKRCFLSSIIFPKGTAINTDEIIRVWMAYGYLNSNGSVDEVQLKGFQYLNNLTMRSFFQRIESDNNDRKSYKMHDIMHDFATYLSAGTSEYSLIMVGGLVKEKSSSSHDNTLPWNSLGRLRTFCAFRELELRPDIFTCLASVRVLSMRYCNLQSLPEDVGKLIHLRYLNLSHNPITKLPVTIIDLCNLQTLDIESCKNLSSLLEGMGKLINLRHLLNMSTHKLVEFPQGIEKLSGLWTLSEFKGSNLGCLRNMNQLHGSLTLMPRDCDEGEFGQPNLWEKQHIETLQLDLTIMEEELDEIVEALKPPPNLLTLEIISTSSKWLSCWIATSFDNLKKIVFNGRGKCCIMPPFCKLPALEELQIIDCGFDRLSNEFLGLTNANNITSSSIQVVGGFPRLKKLCFFNCEQWREWEDIKEEEKARCGSYNEVLE